MLTFNPEHRYFFYVRANVEECIRHPYFEGLHSPEDEPICQFPYDWSTDNFELKKETL
jgi:hypothetical protein